MEKNWRKREILFQFLDLVSDKFLNKIIKLIDYILARIWIIFCIFVNEGMDRNRWPECVGIRKLVIKCTLSFSLKSIKYCAKQFSRLPPLPEYIIKRGPYINGSGVDDEIIITYEFDKSKLAEAWENISKHWDVFRSVGGVALSAQILKKSAKVNKVHRLE